MKKISHQAAKVLEDIVGSENQSFEMNGRHYKIVELKSENKNQTTVAEDIEKDPVLKEKLLQSKKAIAAGRYFTSKEMREMIKNGQI